MLRWVSRFGAVTASALRASRAVGRPALVRRFADAAPAQASEPAPKTGAATASPKISALADQIGALTVLEAAQLATLLKSRFNLPDVAPVAAATPAAAAAAPAAAAAAAEAPKAEKTSFTVRLVAVDAAKKINAIKELRSINQALQLKEAKDMVESLPKVVKDNVSKEEAEEIKKKFAAVGATVQID